MMSPEDLCAVVISYHPDDAALDNLKLLRQQLARIVVIDNGSADVPLGMLRDLSRTLGFELIENTDNPGEAFALNQGIRRARDLGFAFVMPFKQEGAITEGYAAAMLHYLEHSTAPQSIAILVPVTSTVRPGTATALRAAAARTPAVARTLEIASISGSLIPTEIFSVAGFFAEDLYLDGIDAEFSLRVRRLGFLIEQCPGATLLLEAGAFTSGRLFGSRLFRSANVSPIRRYYQERSKVWLLRHYGRSFPGFCLRQFVHSGKTVAKILLAEHEKLAKCQFFFEGLLDGLRGVTGKKRINS